MKNRLNEIELTDQQFETVGRLQSGNLLLGGVGSGKTFTSIFWCYSKGYTPDSGKKVIVITTAATRDKNSWQDSFKACGYSSDDYIVDSWNNIKNYQKVVDGLFVFDEQRVVGYGTWARTFIQLAWKNDWILLTATPGDNYSNYMPVLIANKFYRNKTDFKDQHIIENPYTPYPSIKGYQNTEKLDNHISSILITMDVVRHTTRRRVNIHCDYDKMIYKQVVDTRFNHIEDRPIENASEYVQLLRRVVNTSDDRLLKVERLMEVHEKMIVFYNYNYELNELKKVAESIDKPYFEWNGHKHQSYEGDEWVYFVQYNAGAEGWNCIDTNIMCFYSLNYSYKMVEQAEGRIDRMNTPFEKLYYYYLTTNSDIDRTIMRAVKNKKKFNEKNYVHAKGGF